MNFRINRCLRFEEQREQKESVLESRQIEFNSATVDWLEFNKMFRPRAEILATDPVAESQKSLQR